MAHKKGLGSSKNGRDSQSKRLGVKVFAGQHVHAGSIIVPPEAARGSTPARAPRSAATTRCSRTSRARSEFGGRAASAS